MSVSVLTVCERKCFVCGQPFKTADKVVAALHTEVFEAEDPDTRDELEMRGDQMCVEQDWTGQEIMHEACYQNLLKKAVLA